MATSASMKKPWWRRSRATCETCSRIFFSPAQPFAPAVMVWLVGDCAWKPSAWGSQRSPGCMKKTLVVTSTGRSTSLSSRQPLAPSVCSRRCNAWLRWRLSVSRGLLLGSAAEEGFLPRAVRRTVRNWHTGSRTGRRHGVEEMAWRTVYQRAHRRNLRGHPPASAPAAIPVRSSSRWSRSRAWSPGVTLIACPPPLPRTGPSIPSLGWSG